MPHHIVVVGGSKEAVVSAFLVPNSEEHVVLKNMGQMNNYTHLFSLSQAADMNDPRRSGARIFAHELVGSMWLLPVAMRPPKILFDAWAQSMRTSWLGKDEWTIDQDVSEIIRIVNEVAADMKGKRF